MLFPYSRMTSNAPGLMYDGYGLEIQGHEHQKNPDAPCESVVFLPRDTKFRVRLSNSNDHECLVTLDVDEIDIGNYITFLTNLKIWTAETNSYIIHNLGSGLGSISSHLFLFLFLFKILFGNLFPFLIYFSVIYFSVIYFYFYFYFLKYSNLFLKTYLY